MPQILCRHVQNVVAATGDIVAGADLSHAADAALEAFDVVAVTGLEPDSHEGLKAEAQRLRRNVSPVPKDDSLAFQLAYTPPKVRQRKAELLGQEGAGLARVLLKSE